MARFKALVVAACIAGAGLGITPSSQAATIFSQLPVDGAVSLRSDFVGGEQLADDFSVGAANSLASVHWWGTYDVAPTVAPAFTIRIFNDDGTGNPTVVPFSDQAASNIVVSPTVLHDSTGNNVLDFTADLGSAVSLNASTTYFISIVENTTPDQWNWMTAGGGGFWYRLADNTSWNTGGVTSAFELASVPTPSALGGGLVLLAGMGLIIAKRARAGAATV